MLIYVYTYVLFFLSLYYNMADPDIVKLQGVLDPHGKYPNPLTGRPYSEKYTKFALEKPGWVKMQTYTNRYNFFKLLNNHQIVIAIAGTGTGKTVVIPRLVNHFFGYKKGVFVINPKVSQSIETSATAAVFSDVELGAEVGHVYPLDARADTVKDDIVEDLDDVIDIKNKAYSRSRTKLIFCTDRWMQSFMKGEPDNNGFGGPHLNGYSGVIMDEIHGRSLGQDYLLALFCDLAKSRPDFRIVLMSATLNPKPFLEYFQRINISAAVLDMPGALSFPIERIYSPNEVKLNQITKSIEPVLRDILTNHKDGNIIVFVHSVKNAAILKMKKMLEDESHTFSPRPVFLLFGGEFQNETKPYIVDGGNKDFRTYLPDDGKGEYGRMVVFSTNIGQEGITYRDVTYIIDSGMDHAVNYSPDHYSVMQGSIFVAQANVNQRCGRTGRTMPGTCYSLYSKGQYDDFIKEQIPEISKFDLTSNYLEIITHPNYGSFREAERFFSIMITPPSQIAKFQAMRSLISHNLVDGRSGLPTHAGILLSKTKKFDFRLCKMLIAGIFFTTDEMDCLTPMLYICAILHILGKNGLMDLFKVIDKNNPKYDELIAKQQGIVAHFTVKNSDHLTAYMIYATSRDAAIFQENPSNGSNINFRLRKAWCEDYLLNHNRLKDIDTTVNDIKRQFLDKHRNELLNLDILRITNSKYQNPNPNPKILLAQLGGGSGSGNNTNNIKGKKHLTKRKSHKKIYSRPKTTKQDNKQDNKQDIKDQMMNLMDKINFANNIPTLKSFASPNLNLLACLFFGYVNNIGILENPNKGAYLIKYSKNDLGIPGKTSILKDAKNNSPLLIMYNAFSLSYDNPRDPGEITFVSELPISIIKAFGINFS